MNAAGTWSDVEARFVAAVRNMLARPDFLLPLAAAERQFRDHYYGLNSAALLEDLFFDALGNFLRQTEPTTRLTRPPTGQKGWDYAFDQLQISHKVSQDLSAVAALWDATKQGVTTWSFNEPIVYVLGSNTPSTSLVLEFGTELSVRCRAVADLGKPYLADGRTLLVVNWPADGRQPMLLDLVETERGQTAEEALPFERMWRHVAKHVRQGGAANEIDVVVASRALSPVVIASLTAELPSPVSVAVRFRGGAYLLRRDLLQDLSVTTNNRAILIPKQTIQQLLLEAERAQLFAPLPLWYWVYAEERPPDMYSAQRAEYDARFSARGELDPD